MYLFDKEFLKKLDSMENRELYARIIVLDNNDYPLEEIEGKVSGGSINIDGASAVRRSCNLTLAVKEMDLIVTDKFWSYNNKFKVQIGLKNYIESNYPDIIWFDMGIYIISSFNKSKQASSFSVSISGKDKMCRLNGEMGGTIPMDTDFGTIETVDEDNNVTIDKVPIVTIIQQALREYGQETMENIIINDLDSVGYELWEYRGDNPFYLIAHKDSGTKYPKILTFSFEGKTPIDKIITSSGQEKNVSGVKFSNFEKKGYKYYSLNTLDKDYNNDATLIKYGNRQCYLIKIDYGETAGYHSTPLIYPSDLILKAGETVTSLLDKLKGVLGEFEYFYDTNGRFIFQKKKTYVSDIFTPFNNDAPQPIKIETPYEYQFTDLSKITSISETPNVTNVKNDYSVWGTRKSSSGAQLPIHVRYGIEKRPISYHSLAFYSNGKLKEGEKRYSTTDYDYREIIYQMAVDYYRHNQENDFLIKLEHQNPQYINGKTGYEPYYSDLQAFWRQLYNPNPTDEDIKIYGEFYDENGSDGKGNDKYWNKRLHSDPGSFNFWIELEENLGDLSGYSIDKIGLRSKVVNESKVSSIIYKETPEVLFVITPDETTDGASEAYTPLQITKDARELFVISSQGLSATNKLNELLNIHLLTAQNVNLTTIPIFYLQPNTKIYVEGIGDCTLSKISYQLNYNGTMNLTCTKNIQNFI